VSVRKAAPAVAVLAILLVPAAPAVARSSAARTSGSRQSAHKQPVPQAPGGPPLGGEGAAVEGEASSAPPSGGSALVENGLGSPMCREGAEAPSPDALRNCELAGFIASPDPIGDYALDVNIDTGVTKVTNDIASTIQNFTGFAWMVFVSITQGLIVMLEWCYSLDKLTGELLGGIRSALQSARLSLTEPWLPATLALAAALVAYHGLVRRRVAQALGQALAMFAMMAAGLWLIAEPARTIGVLDHWANQAGLGTLGAVASGSPEQPERTFAGDMRRLFGAAINSSWCYMEFGNVGWCRGALDPGLRKAALAIAGREQSESGCHSLCGIAAGPKDKLLAASAALLREARSNGELFLALPADEAARNSTKQGWSLLSVLCGGEGKPSDKCAGPTAAQAEFRSEKGTEPRVIGVCLVWLGGLGMLALLGFLALHLLTAAIRTVVLLLLAPAAVLAPAFGEGGRSLFRTWITRLFAAAVSKLIYSFVLGVVLLMVYLLLHLTALGWWGQWLVLSAFWWGTFVRRHEISALIEGPGYKGQGAPHRQLAQALGVPRAVLKKVGRTKGKRRTPAPDPPDRKKPDDPPEDPGKTEDEGDEGRPNGGGHSDGRGEGRDEGAPASAADRTDEQTGPASGLEDEHVTRTLDYERDQAIGQARDARAAQLRIYDAQEKLGRLRRERARALAEKDPRRVAKLDVRAQRVQREIADRQQALSGAIRRVFDGDAAQRRTGSPHTRDQHEERSRFLDTQAALPAAGRRDEQGLARDYAALAGIAGYGVEEYRRLEPREQREARLQIDRELAERHLQMREQGRSTTSGRPADAALDEKADGASDEHAEEANRRPSGEATSDPPSRSPVMDDAFAVEQRRKRQLGRELFD